MNLIPQAAADMATVHIIEGLETLHYMVTMYYDLLYDQTGVLSQSHTPVHAQEGLGYLLGMVALRMGLSTPILLQFTRYNMVVYPTDGASVEWQV